MTIRKLIGIFALFTSLTAATAPTIDADDVEVRTAHVVPEGIVTWGTRVSRVPTHYIGDAGRFLYKHHKLLTAGGVVASACAITWVLTTIVYEDEHRPRKLSSECLAALQSTLNGTIYLTKDVALHLAETGDEIFKYFCGFARTDTGNVLCCDSKGDPVVPDSPWSIPLNIIGHVWDCYASVEDNWKRFLGYEL